MRCPVYFTDRSRSNREIAHGSSHPLVGVIGHLDRLSQESGKPSHGSETTKAQQIHMLVFKVSQSEHAKHSKFDRAIVCFVPRSFTFQPLLGCIELLHLR